MLSGPPRTPRNPWAPSRCRGPPRSALFTSCSEREAGGCTGGGGGKEEGRRRGRRKRAGAARRWPRWGSSALGGRPGRGGVACTGRQMRPGGRPGGEGKEHRLPATPTLAPCRVSPKDLRLWRRELPPDSKLFVRTYCVPRRPPRSSLPHRPAQCLIPTVRKTVAPISESGRWRCRGEGAWLPGEPPLRPIGSYCPFGLRPVLQAFPLRVSKC